MLIRNRKNQIIRFGIYLLVLFVVCIVPHFPDLYSFNRNSVNVNNENVKYVSVRNTTVNQTLYLQGKMSELEIFFYVPSGQLYQQGTVEISVAQGEKRKTQTVEASQILVHSKYERLLGQEIPRSSPIVEKKAMYRLRSGFSDFTEGEAVLSISGINLPAGTDLFCGVAEDILSGLPNATQDINDLGHPLVLQYQLLKINGQFWYETILLVLLMLTIVVTAYLLTNPSGLICKKGTLFICAFAIIFLFVCIQNPLASLQGEPRSEAAYEFWYKAHTMGFWKSLMALMSGESLVWTERIMMWVADALSPTKYVFVVAQMMELIFICGVTAMPCSRIFKKYLSNETRLLFSIFCGTSLLFFKAYYFWSVSYWALFFLLFFAFVEMERLKRGVYLGALILTVILCASRIYHVVFIPIALAVYFLLGKKQGKRFQIYCLTVAGASTFEVVYSLAAGKHLMENARFAQNALDLGIGKILENTLYYQVQVLNSFFTATEHKVGSVSNLAFLALFALIIGLFCFLLFSKKYPNKILPCILGSCGVISLGTIMVSVITSGSYEMIMFPINYAGPINWNNNYYQQPDLHFSYAYIVLAFLLMVTAYYCEQKIPERICKDVLEKRKPEQMASIKRWVQGGVAFLIVLLCSNLAHRRESYIFIPTQWKQISHITENDAYFASINAFYGAAPISLEHNSDEYVYGVDKQGIMFAWKFGDSEYQFDLPYNKAEIGNVTDIETKKVLSCTVRRAMTNFDYTYVAIFENRAGEEITRVAQSNTPERIWLDFIPEQPLEGVANIRFELADGKTAYIVDALQVGYILEEK